MNETERIHETLAPEEVEGIEEVLSPEAEAPRAPSLIDDKVLDLKELTLGDLAVQGGAAVLGAASGIIAAPIVGVQAGLSIAEDILSDDTSALSGIKAVAGFAGGMLAGLVCSVPYFGYAAGKEVRDWQLWR